MRTRPVGVWTGVDGPAILTRLTLQYVGYWMQVPPVSMPSGPTPVSGAVAFVASTTTAGAFAARDAREDEARRSVRCRAAVLELVAPTSCGERS